MKLLLAFLDISAIATVLVLIAGLNLADLREREAQAAQRGRL